MPTADPPLAGVQVVITRPAAQADDLAELVRRAGGEPILFPTLEILPLKPSALQVEQAAQAGIVIFISANAAAHGYPILSSLTVATGRIIAVGDATRRALEALGCRDVLDPGDHASSEGLLESPLLKEVAGQRICIVRGRGGREMLRQSLESRGARVSYLECYRRRVPSHWEPGILTRALDSKAGMLAVTATSVAGLSNLISMAPDAHRHDLLSRPLVVFGGRQKAAALEHGWQGPVIESAAGDEQLVATIVEWRRGPAA